MQCVKFSHCIASLYHILAVVELHTYVSSDLVLTLTLNKKDLPAELACHDIEAAQFPSPTVDPIYTKTFVRTTGD